MRDGAYNLKQFTRVVGILFACASFLQACGATGASPPVSIPAPVAGLISISSPSSTGEVRITGADGAATSGATMTVSFPSSSSTLLKAQGTVTTTVATGSGSFGADFTAGLGDSFEVTQTANGETSLPTTVTVIDGRPFLGATPLGTVTSQPFNIGCALFVSGGDTDLGCFSLSTFVEAAVTATGFVGSDLAIDDTTGDFYLIANTSDEAIVVDAFGFLKGGVLNLTAPASVAADEDLTFAVVAQDNAALSMTMIDNTGVSPVLDATLLITHPTNGAAAHLRTISIAADHTSLDASRFAVLSEFDNGDTIFSFLTATAPPIGSLVVSSQVNLGSAQFDSVTLFNSATEALVSDTTNNQVVHLEGVGFATQTVTSVGTDPRGMAISEALAFAFVCNRGSHTVSIVDLLNDQVVGTMTTLDGVGLGPTDIAINPSPFIGVIANQVDLTATLFDINNVLTALGII